VTGARLGRDAQPCRVHHAAVHGHLPEIENRSPKLFGIRDATTGWRVRDDDFGDHVGRDWAGGGAHLEITDGGHVRHSVIAHDHEIGDFQTRVDSRIEAKPAMYRDGVGDCGGVVDRDDVSGIDMHNVIRGWHLTRGPR
jgi:hypothetical protein